VWSQSQIKNFCFSIEQIDNYFEPAESIGLNPLEITWSRKNSNAQTSFIEIPKMDIKSQLIQITASKNVLTLKYQQQLMPLNYFMLNIRFKILVFTWQNYLYLQNPVMYLYLLVIDKLVSGYCH
jgi:hypothetical protein